MNEYMGLLTVHFTTDTPNIDINDIGCRIKTKVPDMLQQHRPGNHLTFVANQIFKKLEFSRQQLYFSPSPTDCSRNEIHL